MLWKKEKKKKNIFPDTTLIWSSQNPQKHVVHISQLSEQKKKQKKKKKNHDTFE